MRPHIRKSDAVHVTLRVVPEIAQLRRMDAYAAIRRAANVVLGRPAFRIVHISIQTTHIHLLVEADDKHALAVGMKGFQVSAARRLNVAEAKVKRRGAKPRKGSVFVDRYNAQLIDSPRRARHALAYVLRGSTRINFLSREPSTALCLSTPRTRLLRRAAAEGHVSDGSRDAQSPNEILCECRGYVFDDRERRINRSRATRGRMQAVAQQ